MQKKTDRRVRKTKTQLRNGLAMLMKEKSVGEITVKELVDQVDINRSTFYLHYPDISGLLYEIENDLAEEMERAIREHPIEKREDNGFYFLQDIFQVLDNNREIVSALVGPYGDMRFIQKVEVILARNSREVLEQMFPEKSDQMDYFYAYCLNGCLGFVKTWLADKKSCTPEFAADFARIIDNTSVIGIIASVRVSFTVTAVFSVSLPRFHILSQVEAAAVTEEVSLIAVPANNPKELPLVVSKPSALPSTGKSTAAITLKKKITEIACATSVSSASMTGAVAAIADPPQMDEPTPTRIEVFDGTFMILRRTHAMIREVLIVHTMIGRDCFPVCRITPRFIPNPSSTTAVCKIILEVHLIPGSAFPLLVHTSVISIPARIAMTGPPITGKAFPRSHDGTAITKQTSIPFRFFFKKFMFFPLSHSFIGSYGFPLEIITLDNNNK